MLSFPIITIRRAALVASAVLGSAGGGGWAQKTGSVVSPTYTSASAVTIQPGADSTSAVQITSHSSTPVASIDTTNNRVIIGSGAPANALVVGVEATGSTLVPASSVEIGSTTASSILTLGQSSAARLSVAWSFAGQSGTVTTQGTQPLNLQSNGGTVVLGGGFAPTPLGGSRSIQGRAGRC